MVRTNLRGFTLIELLIVVAIIAILALIAVPNFLEAQTRAKVSRVQNDLRSLATAVESYRVDHNCVPPYDSWNGPAWWPPIDKITTPGPFWVWLTTPIAYITSPLRDPFVLGSVITAHPGSTHPTLDVWFQVGVGNLGATAHNTPDHWCASSFGPDFSDDTPNLGDYPYTDSACPYDPTNGTVSRGDIYRHGARVPTNFLSNNNRNLNRTDNPYW